MESTRRNFTIEVGDKDILINRATWFFTSDTYGEDADGSRGRPVVYCTGVDFDAEYDKEDMDDIVEVLLDIGEV